MDKKAIKDEKPSQQSTDCSPHLIQVNSVEDIGQMCKDTMTKSRLDFSFAKFWQKEKSAFH